jgi:hypothetical protein
MRQNRCKVPGAEQGGVGQASTVAEIEQRPDARVEAVRLTWLTSYAPALALFLSGLVGIGMLRPVSKRKGRSAGAGYRPRTPAGLCCQRWWGRVRDNDVDLHLLSASTVAEIDQAFVQLGQQRPDALLLYGDLFFTGQRDLIIALAARHRIPTIYHAEEFTRAGGLISYGAENLPEPATLRTARGGKAVSLDQKTEAIK